MSGAEGMLSTRWTAALFCFSLCSAWPTAPPTTHYPSLSQRQICSFLHGPFCVTHRCDVVITPFVLTDLFVGEMVVMSSSCLTILPDWLLHSPGVFTALGMSHLSYQTFLLLVAVWPSVHILRKWCLCLLDFWHSAAWCPGCLEKEVSTSMAEKTSSSTKMGVHGESIWELGALQGEQGKEEQRLWLKQGHWLCPLWCCRDWTRLGEKAGWRINSSKAGEQLGSEWLGDQEKEAWMRKLATEAGRGWSMFSTMVLDKSTPATPLLARNSLETHPQTVLSPSSSRWSKDWMATYLYYQLLPQIKCLSHFKSRRINVPQTTSNLLAFQGRSYLWRQGRS